MDARFTLSFNYALDNAERLAMAELYQKAFHAKKTYEGTPPNSDEIHIMLDIGGTEILLCPGAAVGKGLQDPIVCEVRFADEHEFTHAFETLTEEGRRHSLEGPYPWADKLGLVEDKFGVGWALYYNK